ncbi:hypothetical protein [Pedococcus sp. 5OH_020]|jgi:hypothetical protein|nr:hypothetical protein [Pedococcus sp. 5OH_020]
MRTDHTHLHLPQHPSRWWLSHTVLAVVGALLVIYVAAVLLVLAAVFLF